MAWVRTYVGGDNRILQINTEHVEYATEEDVNGRLDIVLYMTSGRTFRISPETWQRMRGDLAHDAVSVDPN